MAGSSMRVESATLEEALGADIDFDRNAFLMLHSWTAGAPLLDFVEKAKGHLSEKPMTLAELAAAGSFNEGPLAIMLRICSILGYTTFDPAKGTYSLVQGLELDELETHLGPQSNGTAEALRGIYAEAPPPFKMTSQEAARCLEVWKTNRPSWRNSKSTALRLLLDGIVITPLLTSIAFYVHYDDEGQSYGDDPLESLDLSCLTGEHRATMAAMLKELQLGEMNEKGVLEMRPECSESLQQAQSFFHTVSYSPMLANFKKILAEEPAWGFDDADESPVHPVLHKLGEGLVQKPLCPDMLRHINIVFEGENFASQPRAIMEMGCGDGSLLVQIYKHIKHNLPRGQNLDEHPLLMIGVDSSEDNRMAAAVNFNTNDIPHMTQNGNIAKPAETMTLLKKFAKKRKIEPKQILHIRAFQDSKRKFIAPTKQHAEDSRLAMYAKAQMGDFFHLDKDGKPIKAVDIFASLVEHFQRWAGSMDGSFGLCMLEEMMLDVPTSKRFLTDSLAFSTSSLGSLARQYMIAPGAFIMAGAMAGLFPAKYDQVQNYPEQGHYTLVLNQHLVLKPFTLRLAELSDLPELLRLEEIGWAPNLRKDEDGLRRRLETSPTTCFVCEMKQKIIAVLYVQKISSIETIDNEVFDRVSDSHDPAGRILQLLAIIGDTTPEVKLMGIGNELRCFVLHMARMDPGVDFVCAVTRCGDFRGEASEMQKYMDDHAEKKLEDSIVGFHTGYGAKVVKIVPNYRPEDTDNKGIGVLIKYDMKDWRARDQVAVKAKAQKKKKATVAEGDSKGEDDDAKPDNTPGVDIIKGIMAEIGYPVDEDSLDKGFFSFGMDSLDLVRIRSRIGGVLGCDLASTLLLDFPNVMELSDFLDKERCIGKYKGKGAKKVEKSVWEKMSDPEITFVVDKFIKFYSLPQYQAKIEEARKKSGTNARMFAESMEPTRNEVEGPILVSNEVLKEANPNSIMKVREELDAWMNKNSARAPKIRAKHKQMMDLIALNAK